MNKFDYQQSVDYWSNRPPEDKNHYLNYMQSSAFYRSVFLVRMVLKCPGINRYSRILEIGCNAKRNLHVLENSDFENLYGFDVNNDALVNGFRVRADIQHLSITDYYEKYVPEKHLKFDLTFSMAVLEHIPPEAEYIFSDIVKNTRYLITIEDEQSTHSERIFQRNYKTVFESLGMEEIFSMRLSTKTYFSRKFYARIFH